MSKIKLSFDPNTHSPEEPTIVLANKNGDKIGQIKARNIIVKDSMINPSEISFNVNKFENNSKNNLWDKIVNFRLIWCKEWDIWFEISVEIDESNKTIKYVSGVQLGQAELSKIKLFNIEINTEKDIARDDYEITILFDENNPKASLLNRIMEKTPHYSIAHVDTSVAKIQRSFSFDDISIHDAFQEISEEIGCVFVYNSNSDENENIVRSISIYDLQQNCNDCGYRGEYTDKCPKCGSDNIIEGYGNDTTIFISSDEIANDLRLTTDTGAVNNCFKLEAGDDLMTATIRNCNPNGSDYIWYISNEMKEIMSDELVTKLNQYDDLYRYYQSEYLIPINSDLLNKYNIIVSKYKTYNEDLEQITIPIKGYPSLMTAYYNTVDLAIYLQSVLMPDAKLNDTNAEEQAKLLTSENLSPIAATNTKTMTVSSANNAVLAMAKSIIDSRYQVKVNNSSFANLTWTGDFTVTNYSDDEDTTVSSTITITITDDYEKYVKQQIDKLLNKEANDLSVSGLFKKSHDDFCNELKKYCLDILNSFYNICQSCIDILIEQGIADKETWADKNPSLYDELYLPYRNKLDALQIEIGIREEEINTITGIVNDGEIITAGLQTHITELKEQIQKALNFEEYLGKNLWLEFYAYRREDKYSNNNYISDGLNNSELFNKALEFLDTANKEIFKSATQQHAISSNLKNIFAIEKFKSLYNYFEVGNWLRILIDDKVYKLRLLEYEIDYDNLSDLSTVDFSDVLKIINGISDSKSVFEKATSIATSYDYVQRQANQGAKGNEVVNNWTSNGLDVTKTKLLSGAEGQTQTWDEHGILLRKYDSITETYNDEQMRILNSSIVITDDNWNTAKTAVGGYYYYDPVSSELKYTYGINAETLIGDLILGEKLGIYTENGSLTFNDNGLSISNGKNTFIVNPNSDKLLSLTNKSGDVLSVDESGNAIFSGEVKSSTIIGSNINNSVLKGIDGEFSSGFKVSVPVTIDSSNFKWVMSANQNDGVFIGTQCNEDDPLFAAANMSFNNEGVKIISKKNIEISTNRGFINLSAPSGETNITGDLNVSGTKSRIINTLNYNTRKLYCYETATPYFGDIGHGVIGDDGLCYIDIDIIFAETIDTSQDYTIFLQSYSDKQVYVYEKECDFFIVKGEPLTRFDFEIKARQKDYPIERLEEQIVLINEMEIDYEEQAENYLKSYEKELIIDE